MNFFRGASGSIRLISQNTLQKIVSEKQGPFWRALVSKLVFGQLLLKITTFFWNILKNSRAKISRWGGRQIPTAHIYSVGPVSAVATTGHTVIVFPTVVTLPNCWQCCLCGKRDLLRLLSKILKYVLLTCSQPYLSLVFYHSGWVSGRGKKVYQGSMHFRDILILYNFPTLP